MMNRHSGTFTVACSVTKNCAGRRRGVLHGVLVCTSCDETATIPNALQIEPVPTGASQWWVRPLQA